MCFKPQSQIHVRIVACGASGTSAVKYGTMRENILAVRAVLPDGSIVQCGTNARKSSAGYDLLSLMCGSEGTLGVITDVTVKLHPLPSHLSAAVCVFETLHEAAQAVAGLYCLLCWSLLHIPLHVCLYKCLHSYYSPA